MARKIRIEFAGARYHVINRGNYRSWIFETEGARKSFLDCLEQVSEAQGWFLHGWCLMGNHYHLLMETPKPNLVEGMRWLQSTFANRFNRFRKTTGHVFHGRYKAILLEEAAVGAVCHYIHLNPVRAGLIKVGELQQYRSSSFQQLWFPRRRWRFGNYKSCLEAAGGLPDSPKGRRRYRDYLAWLSAEEPEQKKLGFEKMTRGWAQGSKEFKKALLESVEDPARLSRVVESEASELREFRWEKRLDTALAALGKTRQDLQTTPKSVPWKVAAARYMRERYLAPNRWIAEHLNMGAVSSVQSLVSRHRNQSPQKHSNWEILKNHETLD